MLSFLIVPLLDINRNYQMFTQHSFVLPIPLMTKCSYSEEVEDTEHYSAGIGYDIDA